jgi:hypothetical protein
VSQIQISLNEDDAIILFEIMTRLGDSRPPTVASEAEFESVDMFVCTLESVLVAPFRDDYGARVEQILTQRQLRRQSEENQ